jgi:hypothetical protein
MRSASRLDAGKDAFHAAGKWEWQGRVSSGQSSGR